MNHALSLCTVCYCFTHYQHIMSYQFGEFWANLVRLGATTRNAPLPGDTPALFVIMAAVTVRLLVVTGESGETGSATVTEQGTS